MLGSGILEIIIGLAFTYLLFSTLVTLINEYISSIFGLRAANLKKIIQRALDDDNIAKFSGKFFEHPLITGFGKGSKYSKSEPSYLSEKKFAKVVLDIIRTQGDMNKLGSFSSLDQNTLSRAIKEIDESVLGDHTKKLLISFAKEAGEDINDFGKRLELWFNESIQRGQGWFNRQMKWITFVVSFAISVAFNLNSISIYENLSQDPELRAEIANNASEYIKNNEPPVVARADSAKADMTDDERLAAYDSAQLRLERYYAEKIKKNNSMNALGIGWNKSTYERQKWYTMILGWLITAFAVSLGAPFWFGVLNKLVSLRSSAKSGDYEKDPQHEQVKSSPNGG